METQQVSRKQASAAVQKEAEWVGFVSTMKQTEEAVANLSGVIRVYLKPAKASIREKTTELRAERKEVTDKIKAISSPIYKEADKLQVKNALGEVVNDGKGAPVTVASLKEMRTQAADGFATAKQGLYDLHGLATQR